MTIKQKQCLLCYLGYYDGKIDGIWGDQSEQATMCFQNDYGLEVDGVFGSETEEMAIRAVAGEAEPKPVEPVSPEQPDDFWNSVKYFRREEFRCKCGGKYCNGFPAEPSSKLVRLADRVREHFGAAAIVSSGVRCETHNAKVGGVSGSRHKIGTAMDFCIRGMSSAMVLDYVQKQGDTNYAYAIDSCYVHMDVVE